MLAGQLFMLENEYKKSLEKLKIAGMQWRIDHNMQGLMDATVAEKRTHQYKHVHMLYKQAEDITNIMAKLTRKKAKENESN